MSCDIEINENMQNARTVSNPAGCLCHLKLLLQFSDDTKSTTGYCWISQAPSTAGEGKTGASRAVEHMSCIQKRCDLSVRFAQLAGFPVCFDA